MKYPRPTDSVPLGDQANVKNLTPVVQSGIALGSANIGRRKTSRETQLPRAEKKN